MRQVYFDLLIDGTPVLVPDAGLEMEYTDLDGAETGRDESGVMHRILLRSGVRKFTIHYASLTREEYRYMQSLLAGKATFEVTYRDHDGFPKTFRAYHAAHAITVQNVRTGLYKDCKFPIIEC